MSIENHPIRICLTRKKILNKGGDYKYKMLVTLHAIFYVITELCTPSWQKELRDITFFIVEAMEEAKKKEPVTESVKLKYSSRLCKHA